jgi:hypothetical protein
MYWDGTEEIMVPVEVKELRKHEIEIDVLKDTPVEFDVSGRP